MGSSDKMKVHQFDPVIYPRKIWIVKGKNIGEEIKSNFIHKSGGELITCDMEGCYAGVYGIVRYKETDKLGVLIWLFSEVDVESYAHEAVHVVNKIFSDLDIDYAQEHDEHFAYFVGKVADWMHQVWTEK